MDLPAPRHLLRRGVRSPWELQGSSYEGSSKPVSRRKKQNGAVRPPGRESSGGTTESGSSTPEGASRVTGAPKGGCQVGAAVLPAVNGRYCACDAQRPGDCTDVVCERGITAGPKI